MAFTEGVPEQVIAGAALYGYATEDRLRADDAAVVGGIGWLDGRAVLVVGHQPTFGRIASRLLTGRSGDLSMKKGSIWWFSSKIDEEIWQGETLLRAVIAPDFAQD